MKDTAYWDERASVFIRHGHRGIWRDFSDRMNEMIFRRYLTGQPVQRILKTDLFDEALISGIVPPMASFAAEVHGIDISPRIVQTASNHYPSARFTTASVTSLPYPDHYFDAVVSLSTLDQLETFSEIHQALAEIHRVLKPSGQLLITFDNLSNPLLFLRNRFGLPPGPYFMGQSIRAQQLQPLLETTGFSVRSTFTHTHALRPVAIKLCRFFEQRGPREPLIHALLRFEWLAKWPTRNFTANYCGALAIKK